MMPTAAWLVASALFGPDLTGASYRELVLRYAKGDRAAAVAELGDWSEKDLARELDRLRSWERRARQCQDCEEKYSYPRFPLRAAVLLHTDREDLERRSRSPVDEATPRCGIGPQGVIAKEIALLVLLKPGETSFVGRWFLAMALRSQANACMGDAQDWTLGGLKWFPKDPELLLADGTINETTASLSWDAVSTTGLAPSGRKTPNWQTMWLKKARQAFERALEADPGLVEARLRSGRVQWLLGDKAAAHASFDAVLASDGDDSVLYKARLFRGRCYEEEKELARAEADYRAALALAPAAQAAAVAVSYVSWLQGKTTESRDVLEHALLQAGRRTGPDPYWDYSFGRSDRAESAFREPVGRGASLSRPRQYRAALDVALALGGAFALSGAGRAQTPPTPPVFPAGVEAVYVDAFVTHGRTAGPGSRRVRLRAARRGCRPTGGAGGGGFPAGVGPARLRHEREHGGREARSPPLRGGEVSRDLPPRRRDRAPGLLRGDRLAGPTHPRP